MTKIVSYIRVSTNKQSIGLDAQRYAIAAFATQHGLEIAQEFIEKESGKGSDALARRPQLAAALAAAKKLKCSIVVAKLDRLSRNVNFISGLMDAKVPFIVAAIGLAADPFMLHIYAALAEQERTVISQPTSTALQRLNADGMQFGCSRAELAKAILGGAELIDDKDYRFVDGVMPFIAQ